MLTSLFYVSNIYVDHFLKDAEDIRRHGFNTICFPITDHDLLYRKENMKELILAAKGSGFTTMVSPASIGNLFGYGSVSSLLTESWDNRIEKFGGEKQNRVCPRSYDFVRVMNNLLDVARLADWFLLDEPDLSHCFCSQCRSSVPMTRFLQDYIPAIQDRGLKVSVCWWGGRIHPETYTISEWVDDIGVSLPPEYFGNQGHYSMWFDYIKNLAGMFDKTTSVWHQGYSIQDGWEGYINESIRLAKDHGIDNQGSWIFRGGEGASYARSENYQEVWRQAELAFRKLNA